MSSKVVLEHFLKTSSAHGYIKLSDRIKNPHRKRVWFLILVLASGTCMYHLYTFAAKFIENPVSTKIKFEIRDNLYPSITICYNLPYFVKNLSNPVPRYNSNFSDVDKLTYNYWINNLPLLNVPFTDLYNIYTRSIMPLAYQSEVLVVPQIPIIRCYMNNRFDCLGMFNKSFMYENRPCISGYITQDRITNLKIIILWPYPEIYPKNVMSFISYNSFISVYLHAKDTYPTGLGHKATKSQYNLNIYYQLLSHNLTCNEDRGDIKILSRLTNESLTFKYSKILCDKVNTQRTIWKACNCVSELLPVPMELGQFVSGTIDNYCHAIWGDLQNSSRENFSKIQQRILCHNMHIANMSYDCLEMCHYYDVSGTSQHSTHKPDLETMDNYKRILANLTSETNTNTLQRNFFNNKTFGYSPDGDLNIQNPYDANLQIGIAYSPDVLVYESKVLYGQMTFISDIGGIIGLYMGWSILTVIEILVFLLELVVYPYYAKFV